MRLYNFMIRSACFVLVLLIVQVSGLAQGNINYPINISPVIFPPFPSSIQMLSNATTPSIYLTINNKSSNATVQNVLLGVTIQGNGFTAQTRSLNNTFPVTLVGNTPLRLSNVDFASLYNFANLSGISLAQFNSAFPQSVITYGFVVYDAVTKLQLSDRVTYQVTFAINNPPLLNSPSNNSLIVERGVQNIFFQWQPRQATAAGSVRYKLQIIRLLDTLINPQMAFTGSPTYFFEDSTITNTYNYNAFNPPLLSNQKYAWRVQAVPVDNGGFTATTFANGGYSNVESFRYVAECKTPSQVTGSNISVNGATISWSSFTNNQTFALSYKTQTSATWTNVPIPSNNISNSFAMSKLAEGTNYQVKIMGFCFGGQTVESPVYNFKTSVTVKASDTAKKVANAVVADIKAACGQKPVLGQLSQAALTALADNDVITAGDYRIVVSNVRGAAGLFSGNGVVDVWLNGKVFKVNVSFQNVRINVDKRVIDGNINLVTSSN